MFVFSLVVCLFVLLVGFCIMPIWFTLDLRLQKNKIFIIGLSVASVFTFGLCGILAYILIMVDVKQEKVLDDGIKYDSFLYNRRNEIYEHDMFGWGVYILLYILEFLTIFLPTVSVGIPEVDFPTSLFNITVIEGIHGRVDAGGSPIAESLLYFFVNYGVYIVCAVFVSGILTHMIVRDTRKTVFADSIIQTVYMIVTFSVAFSMNDSSVSMLFSPAVFCMTLMLCITMVTAVIPQTCSLMLARSK